MKDLNLAYLEKRCFSKTTAPKALRIFSNASDEDLFTLLRFHEETKDGISDDETWERDYFDMLISFYGTVEIAAMIGFVRDFSPEFNEQHLAVLCHPAVRRYCEWHYPMDLPRRLRERLQFQFGYTVKNTKFLNSAFYRFLDLTEKIETDEDLEAFLWVLDGGARKFGRRWCNLERVRDALGEPSVLLKSLQTKAVDRNELDRALNGFCKFVQFCEQLSELLEDLGSHPKVAEAMWLGHVYWVRKADTELGSGMNSPLLSLLKWKVPSASKKVLAARADELMSICHKLALPPLGKLKNESSSKKVLEETSKPAAQKAMQM